jgi:hypothetical protein
MYRLEQVDTRGGMMMTGRQDGRPGPPIGHTQSGSFGLQAETAESAKRGFPALF